MLNRLEKLEQELDDLTITLTETDDAQTLKCTGAQILKIQSEIKEILESTEYENELRENARAENADMKWAGREF